MLPWAVPGMAAEGTSHTFPDLAVGYPQPALQALCSGYQLEKQGKQTKGNSAHEDGSWTLLAAPCSAGKGAKPGRFRDS